jgi:hypothetical protein
MERRVRPTPPAPKEVEASIVRRQFKKIGGGNFILGGRVIKPGETFTAMEGEIPVAFRDVIVPAGGWNAEAVMIVKPRKIQYVLQASKEEGLFDIVNLQGKKVNEESLPVDLATRFIQDLES